jgi:cell wall-associated NlpC family hydrolase
VDGLSSVQARVAQIQAMVGSPVAATSSSASASASASASGTSWASAASAAGLEGSATASASESAVVSDARRYLGVPYLWGGTDPAKGLDCSGLTQRVFADVGIHLPRTAAQQATTGTPVTSLADARPGDLVFFDHSSSRAGIDHVGVYIGNGQMIAAPTEGERVKVQPVGTPTTIRRVLPASGGAPSTTGTGSLAGVPYAGLFTAAGARYGVSPAVLAAMASQESGFNASAVSRAGAQGLMQFMPATAAGLGVNALDPASSVDGAARYLSALTNRFGSTPLALAAYNAGPGTVSRYGGIPPYAETQNYVRAVTSKAEAYA